MPAATHRQQGGRRARPSRPPSPVFMEGAWSRRSGSKDDLGASAGGAVSSLFCWPPPLSPGPAKARAHEPFDWRPVVQPQAAAFRNASRADWFARSKAARVSLRAVISADQDWLPALFIFRSCSSAWAASASMRFAAASISTRRSAAKLLAAPPSWSAASRQARIRAAPSRFSSRPTTGRHPVRSALYVHKHAAGFSN